MIACRADHHGLWSAIAGQLRTAGSKRRRGRLVLVGVIYGILGIGAAAAHAGLRYNRSPSVPIGFYWIDTSDRSAEVGSYVAVCPPQTPLLEEAKRRGYLGHGSCPGHMAALLKVVVAGPGDLVEVRDDGVWINHRRWPNSAPLPHDAQGRPLRRQHGSQTVLDNGEMFLLSESLRNGFDSRYFGPISRHLVLGRALRLTTASDPKRHRLAERTGGRQCGGPPAKGGGAPGFGAGTEAEKRVIL